ncbi:MAG: alpha-isopropylmalate synthase regulatory domain-containing protein, partial [Bacilli bacterium]
EEEFGFYLPKAMHTEFGAIVKQASDARGDELANADIFALFEANYLKAVGPYAVERYDVTKHVDGVQVEAIVRIDGRSETIIGVGNGPLDAFFTAIRTTYPLPVQFISYSEHSLGESSNATAVSYIQLEVDGKRLYGVGMSPNIETASIGAVICCLNRAVSGVVVK